jgi:hypothetical protein
VTKCNVWREVLRSVLGADSQQNIEHILDLQRIAEGLSLKEILFHHRKSFLPYVDMMKKLYEAISQVSQSEVLIDSSKVPSIAFALTTECDIDLRVVHLVRDSRAVAYSFKRHVYDPATRKMMKKYTSRQSSVMWLRYNMYSEILRRRVRRSTFVRYEDLAENPALVASTLLDRIGFRGINIDSIGEKQLRVTAESHTASGNPSRLQQGEIQIKSDREWLEKIGTYDRRVVSALTWPLLLRYHYFGYTGS